MPTCFVPGCKAGYKSSNEKRHFFRAPSDKIEEWMRCIPRDDKMLTNKCYVCDVHFASRFILKTFSHVINGEKVEIPRDRWALTSDAYPSNFPNCPKYISRSVPQKRSTRCLTRNEEPSRKGSQKDNTKDLHDTHSQVTTVEKEVEEPSTSEAATTQHPELLYVNKISALQSELLKVKEDLYRCRKQKMIYRKKLKTLQTENLKLHQENTELKMKQLSADKLDSLPPRQKLIIEHMLKACHIKSKKGMRYDINWLLDCLLLKIRSPSLYEFLRNNDYLPLPCQSTLHQYIRGINAKFGFDEDLFVILKTKLETIPQTERQGVLIFDEITLQKHIELSKATGEMIGLVDYGDNSELPQSEFTAGDHGLVFMFRPHFASWVQCIGTFCSKSSVSGSTVAKLILQAIIHLEQCGAIVNAIVCDGASTNKAALKALGICADTNNIQCSFTNPAADRQVLAIIDVPHILKCMRNNLLKNTYFQFPEGRVELQHFKAVVDEDSKLPKGLKACPKVTEIHVNPNNFQRMSVLLAAQIFSNTFADAMLFYKQREVAILKNADVTISFIRHINALFDALNRRLPQEGIRHDSNDLKVIEESLEWLNRWEAFRLQIRSTDQKGFLSHQTAENLRLTLTSILALVRQLLPNSYYILTAHFNQDPLERFFGMIRQGSGSNSHPTTVQFLYVYRLMTVYSLVRPPKRASVQTDPGSMLITLKNLLHSHKKPFREVQEQLEEHLENLLVIQVYTMEILVIVNY